VYQEACNLCPASRDKEYYENNLKKANEARMVAEANATRAAELARKAEEAKKVAEEKAVREEAVGNVRAILTAISGAVGLLLLTMCSNVAMLLLVRSAGRKNEIAIRTAMGASRRRLLIQLLIENLLLASLGGLLGLALAWSCVPLLRAMPVNLPGLSRASIDWRVLAFSLVACRREFVSADAAKRV